MNQCSLTRRHRAVYVRRTQANKVKARLKTGATGHDVGKATSMRVFNCRTRAPILSNLTRSVAIVARAQAVPGNDVAIPAEPGCELADQVGVVGHAAKAVARA